MRLVLFAVAMPFTRNVAAQQEPEVLVDLNSGDHIYRHLPDFFQHEPAGTTAIRLQSGKYSVLQQGAWHKLTKQNVLHFVYHTEKSDGPMRAFLVEAYRLYGHMTVPPQKTVSVYRNWSWPGENRRSGNPFPYTKDTRLSIDDFKNSHALQDVAVINKKLNLPWHAKLGDGDSLGEFRNKITSNIVADIAPAGHVSSKFVGVDAAFLPQQTWRLIAYQPGVDYNGGGSTVPFNIELHGREKYVIFRTITPDSADDPYYVLAFE